MLAENHNLRYNDTWMIRCSALGRWSWKIAFNFINNSASSTIREVWIKFVVFYEPAHVFQSALKVFSFRLFDLTALWVTSLERKHFQHFLCCSFVDLPCIRVVITRHVILIFFVSFQSQTSFFIAIESDLAASRSTFTANECTSGVSLFCSFQKFHFVPISFANRCYDTTTQVKTHKRHISRELKFPHLMETSLLLVFFSTPLPLFTS